MKIGFLTACLPDVPLAELVKWASKTGFSALELAAWPVESDRDYQAKQIDAAKMTAGRAEEIKGLFDEAGLAMSAMAYYDNNLHPDLELRKKNLAHLKHVIKAAQLLGVELVGTFVGSRPDKSPTENMKEFGLVFRDLVKYAEDHNVKLMIENCPMENWVQFGLPGNFAYSPELWNAMFEEVPSENFGLNFDPSHLYWLGIDHIQAIHDFAPRIFHAHAKDTEMLAGGTYEYGLFGRQVDPIPWKSGWWRYRMPGWGEINWQKFISALQENGYDGILSIEHEDPLWEGSEERVFGGLKLGLNHLNQFVI
ncbi:MAG: sugar phosphate isomerase/epimerase [Candidatus Marinimicrobia bacterium]|nr:sugar phosphate isomerase/epimerase [Candidatus Neomarinimicrobiota bacterium]MCF7850925.1 sugar phosphate isomerase/epimerase [Candidatus Neomarinimicrobiota bacterium]